MVFSQKLINERDFVYAEKDKAKKKYDEACESAENSKSRLERALDEKSRDKLRLAWHQEILEMNDKKDLHCLSESTFTALKRVWEAYVNIEIDFNAKCSENTSTVAFTVSQISAERDTEMFIESNPQTAPSSYPRLVPKDFTYIPSALWKDTVGMVTDSFARCFMMNKLVKLKRKLEQVEKDLHIKLNGVDGLERLLEGYMNIPNSGDTDDVFEVAKRIPISSTIFKIVLLQFQLYVVIVVSGMNAHVKCELKIPANCNLSKSPMKMLIRDASEPQLAAKTVTNNNFASTSTTAVISSSIIANRDSQLTLTSKEDESFKNTLEEQHIETTMPRRTPVKGERVVVLYDYVKPNDAVEDLSVMEGQIVEVAESGEWGKFSLGLKKGKLISSHSDDGCGWTKVLCNGEIGLVPTAYIEIPSQDSAEHISNEIEIRVFDGIPGFKTTVLFDFTKTSDDEITVKASQKVWLLDEDDEGSGWTNISDGKQEGLVPTSYLRWDNSVM
ncbi:hypothetical protein HK100_005320 [Physocladia obscura]|uniref:SH3 domain-containing protein n=1 Tax=Physocladia obscura TaxID=109957 RepID=A0AAD5T9T9_9FUNG|nr:hypothetical protein HK100_005320 [Physocladia obscura]